MSVHLTAEQQIAVSARGKVIVSASAGSGKTFVMIERLVSLILEGTDVKNTLAVTFTNKAAAQMKERLRSALLKRLSESEAEERARLKEQLRALPLAEICTIHSFCARLVRTHFYLADVDPAFRVISPDDAEGKLLSSRALDETFEAEYEENGEGFRALLAAYFRKKDAALRAMTLSLYATVRERADYLEALAAAGTGDDFSRACDFLADDFKKRARFLSAEAEQCGVTFAEHGSRALNVCAQIMAAADAIDSCGGLFEMCALPPPVISNMPPSTRTSGELRRKLGEAGKLSAAIKALYKEFKEFAPEAEERRRYESAQVLSRAFGELLLRFDAVYSRLKKEAGVLDYNDLEHSALKVLSDPEARAATHEKYRYVFVDEYQDVNPAQERILSLVSGDEVFLVGDAKQSIYGFRGSRSEYFVQKTKEFQKTLSLTENFRSARAVLDAVNRVFARAMTEEFFDVDYAAALMRGGARHGVHEGSVRFHPVQKEEREEPQRGVYSVLTAAHNETDAQAELLARLIEEEVGSDWFDADAGVMKKVTFGDIAVLVRAGVGDAEKIVRVLSERDIPVTTTASVNVCDFWEARLLIDWLSFLDNPEQDIPLAAAMLSRLGGFTDGELATIRARFPSPYTFRAACGDYRTKMQDGLQKKLDAFFQRAEDYRTTAKALSANDVITRLLADGLEAEIAAKRDGESRLRRVRRLCALAEGSVNDFLRRLKALGYRVDYAESGGEEAVKVLTMHASKGLEFPIVFLASLDSPFRLAERKEVYCTDPFLFAPKCYDGAQKLVHETVLRRASALYEAREDRKGELNLFYVAMTRAKFRLHLLFRECESALSPAFAKRFSDFIDLADCADLFAEPAERLSPPLPRAALAYRPDEETLSALRAAYARPYPHAESVSVKLKSSATDLLGEFPFSAEKLPYKGGSVEEGLAYHAFLEHCTFGGDAKAELRRMREETLLSEEQLALLDETRLEKILALPSLASLGGKRLLREQTFLVALPAREIPALHTNAEDEIVFQGAIDLLVQDENGFLILDYKDVALGKEDLLSHYAPQLTLYRKAVAEIYGVAESTIRARMINLKGLYEVEL